MHLDTMILIVGLLAALTLVAAVAMALLERRHRLDADALLDAPANRNASLILGDMTPALAGQMPIAEHRVSTVQQELREAGFYHPGAVMEYQAIRAALVLTALVVGATLTALA